MHIHFGGNVGHTFVALLAALWIAASSASSQEATDVPSGPVRVVALKMDAENTGLDRRALLREKLAAVLAGMGAGSVDLVVVPEYTFYRGYESDPVKILPDGANFRVVSTGTAKSNEIAAAVSEAQAWAQANNANMILGTVADLVTPQDDPALPASVTFNTQLVIDRLGRIVGYRRKVTEWISSLGLSSTVAKQKALQSLRTWTLSTRGGMDFVVFPIICDEEADCDLLARSAAFNADLVINSECVLETWVSREIEKITKSVQDGAWTPTVPGARFFRDVYVKRYVVSRNAVKPGGWLVAANSYGSTGGMIELNVPPGPLASLNITDHYVHGVIQFASRSEPTNKMPIITAAPSAVPSTVVLPSHATVNVAISDPDNGPWPLYVTWSKVSGLGSVTFSPNGTASAASSSAVFSLAGPYILRAEISDGMDEVSQDLAVLVTDDNRSVNKAPAVSAGPDCTVTSPSKASLKGMVIDDGLPNPPGTVTVKWSHVYNPSTLILSSPNTLATLVTASKPGTYIVRLTASDGALSASETVAVTFDPIPENQPPLANAQSVTTVEDVAKAITLVGTDADGDALTYTVVTNPAHGKLSEAGAVRTYTPAADWSGTDSFTFKVNDGKADSNVATVSIAVTAANDQPIVSSFSPGSLVTVPAGTTQAFSVDAWDVDGDALSYAWKLDGVAVPVTLSSMNYSPVAADAGAHVIAVTVSDGKGGAASKSWDVNVIAGSQAPAVALTAPAAGAVYAAGSSIVLAATASDADGKVVKVEFYQGATKLGEDLAASYGLTWKSVPTGSYTLTAKAFDDQGLSTVSAPVTVKVIPTVTVAVSDSVGSEPGTDTMKFKVSRASSTASALTVYYTVGGTATSGTDYAALPGSVSIPAGASYAYVTVTPKDDAAIEGKETVTFTVSANSAYKLGSTVTGTAWLLDNELPVVTTSAYDAYAFEGSATDTARFKVSRTGSTAAALTVKYAMSGTATNGTDYAGLSGSAVIPAGSSYLYVTVASKADSLVEGREYLKLSLAASSAYQIHSSTAATAYIVDDDFPAVKIAATDAVAAEGGSDTGTFTITRTGPLSSALVVYLKTGGSAVKGADYVAPPASVTIPAGAASVTVKLTAINDSLAEGKETATLYLVANAAYQLSTSTYATVTIYDDEKPEVTLKVTDSRAYEQGCDPAVFTASCFPAAKANLSVAYTVSGTATNGTDYQKLSGTATIPAGGTSATITVKPIDDAVAEAGSYETVGVALAAGSGYALGYYKSGTAYLYDNEPTMSVSVYDSSAAETLSGAVAETGRFKLYRSGGDVTKSLTVGYTMSGTATNGTDYAKLSGSAAIPAGSTYVYVYVTPVNDALKEGSETATLTIAASTAYKIGTASATVTIADND